MAKIAILGIFLLFSFNFLLSTSFIALGYWQYWRKTIFKTSKLLKIVNPLVFDRLHEDLHHIFGIFFEFFHPNFAKIIIFAHISVFISPVRALIQFRPNISVFWIIW